MPDHNENLIEHTEVAEYAVEHTLEHTTEHTEEHSHQIYAENIAQIGGFGITNSLLSSWGAVLIIVLIAMAIKRRTKMVPKGIQNLTEMIIDGFLDFFDGITGSREKSSKFFPFIFSFFTFILVSNWMGLLPGFGTITVGSGHGIALFRGGTADLNTTLALATIAVVASHIVGVMSIGAWNHINKFLNFKALAEIPKKLKKDKMTLLINPVVFLAGLLEIIAEFAKVASLSFRLFGNIFAGEVLLATMSAMLAFGLPLPFMFLEVLVGFVQALVFSLLVLSYLSMSTEKHA